MRIAMISEHASPLATRGGVDAGGQNAHVSALAWGIAASGHDVRVYTRTRRSGDATRSTVRRRRVCGVHVPVGPARPVSKDDLYPYMTALANGLSNLGMGHAGCPMSCMRTSG